MRIKPALRLSVVVVCAGVVWACGDSRSQLSPTSPSSGSSLNPPRSPGTISNAVPRRADNDGDGYEDDAPMPDPYGMPDPYAVPDPNATPTPGGLPLPDGVVVPVQLTINIISTFGAPGFEPNPLQAAVGNTIVWNNADLIVHDIVLDDGRPVGVLAPGQASAAISISTPTIGYHCTLHPYMVGQVTTIVPEQPVPGDPAQIPVPDPAYMPEPSPDPYGGGGYEDYDYYWSPR